MLGLTGRDAVFCLRTVPPSVVFRAPLWEGAQCIQALTRDLKAEQWCDRRGFVWGIEESYRPEGTPDPGCGTRA